MSKRFRNIVLVVVPSILLTLFAFQNMTPAIVVDEEEPEAVLNEFIEPNGHEIAVKDCNRLSGTPTKDKNGWEYCLISKSVRLKEGEPTFQTFPVILQDSDIEFNCGGNSLKNAYQIPRIGVIIRSLRDKPVPENILVKNCHFSGFEGSVSIKSDLNKKEIFELTMKLQHEELRKRSPKGVVIDHIISEKSHGCGVFFGSGVVGATLRNSTVTSNETGPGIYVDFSARNNVIENNYIYKTAREGLALDSAGSNIVRYNEFFQNAHGSVFLYRNCQERILAQPKNSNPNYKHNPLSPLRVDSSSQNLIANNVFRDEVVGVWIASRQSRDLSDWGCGNISPYPAPNDGVHLDYAKENKVMDNVFLNVVRGVIVEDDANKVAGNLFHLGKVGVTVGTKIRSQYGKNRLPVKNTAVENNKYSQLDRFLDVVYDSVGTSDDGNLEEEALIGTLAAAHSGKCLDVSFRNHKPGTRVVQWDCHRHSNQLFYLKNRPQEGGFEIQNLISGLCLDVTDRSKDKATPVQIWTCNGGKHQVFAMKPDQNATSIVAQHSKQCLDIGDASLDNRGKLIQWPCHQRTNQDFTMTPYRRPAFTGTCPGSNLCYD